MVVSLDFEENSVRQVEQIYECYLLRSEYSYVSSVVHASRDAGTHISSDILVFGEQRLVPGKLRLEGSLVRFDGVHVRLLAHCSGVRCD